MYIAANQRIDRSNSIGVNRSQTMHDTSLRGAQTRHIPISPKMIVEEPSIETSCSLGTRICIAARSTTPSRRYTIRKRSQPIFPSTTRPNVQRKTMLPTRWKIPECRKLFVSHWTGCMPSPRTST